MNRFFKFELRTPDPPAARIFYASFLGEGELDIEPLPPGAFARGVPAHWLGHIGVDDVHEAVRSFVAAGATQLGPPTRATDSRHFAVLRDPGGAVVGVSTTTETTLVSTAQPEVIWHQLYAANLERTFAVYRSLFGWRLTEARDDAVLGVHQELSWDTSGTSVGSTADIETRAGVHPHWLFHFRVAALGPALDLVRRAGGVVIGPTSLPSGDRVAMCEDPQRAAFVLHERAETS